MNMFFRNSVIAVTGLFLCVFIHLSANLLLLLPEATARGLYNSYSATLRGNPLKTIVAYLLYLSIISHAIYAAIITFKNHRSKEDRYVINRKNENSTWSSQNIKNLGKLILIFIVVHLVNFWAKVKLGIGENVGLDNAGNEDVYEIAITLFQNVYFVIFYALLMIPLGFHLHHGLKSAFKTLSYYQKKELSVLAKISSFYAIIISADFGIIPLILYFK